MIHGLAERLQTLRKKRGLSQKEVAEAMGISPSILSNYETSERTPSLEALISLASFYRCSTDYLLGFEKCTPSSEQIPNNPLDTSMLSKNQILLLQTFLESLK